MNLTLSNSAINLWNITRNFFNTNEDVRPSCYERDGQKIYSIIKEKHNNHLIYMLNLLYKITSDILNDK